MAKKIYRPHYSTTTDARVVQTREALRAALLKLLESRSLEQITIRDIAREAGIGYTTFFRHHPTKNALLNDVAADEIKRLIDLALSVFDATDTQSAALALCNYVAEHRALWSTLLTGGAAGALRDEFIRLSLEIAASRAPNESWLPAEAGVVLAASGTIELLAWWLRQSDPVPAEQVATIYERIVVSPILNA